MKKTIITLAIIFGLGIGAFAQGGLFKYGAVSDEEYYGAYSDPNRTNNMPLLPDHGRTDNMPAAPLGDGALLLIGFGAAYALKKRNEK